VNPIRTAARHTRHRLAIPTGARCKHCGSSDASVLVSKTRPQLCLDCLAVAQHRSPIEQHHPLGRANDPATIPLRASVHRFFSDRQIDWGAQTLENVTGCGRLRRAAGLRVLTDINAYFVETIALPKARALERISARTEDANA
jgi:hypothetical protein